jgi:hypothetical protein
VAPDRLGAPDTAALLESLALDPASLHADSEDADRLAILRHTLMNPYLVDAENGISYIELYFSYLERECLRLLDTAQFTAAAQPPARLLALGA